MKRSPDGDGLPDIYEWMNGTNPYVADYSSAPRIVAGGEGADDPATLSAAFAASEPYSIIEIAPGVHEGSGWTGISFPAHPVLVTSPNGGVSRSSVLRHTGAGLWALRLESEQTHDTVVQGLVVELAGQGSIQTAFWCGGNLPFMGQPASALFRNCLVRMPKPGVADYCAWKFYRWHSNEVVIAGCAVNAAGADTAIGVQAVDGPPMSVENCSFLNFPHGDDTHKGWGLHYKATALNYGGAEWPVPVEIVNCLFDASFTNAYALAPEGSQEYGPYLVTMLNCMVPSSLTYAPDHSENLMVADYGTLWNGRLASDSPAIGAGTNALYSLRDLDGRFRPFPPSIGAFEPGAATEALDTDGDGLFDNDEMGVHGTDPYLADSDGDGLSDRDEIFYGSSPVDRLSFHRIAAVSVSATDFAVDVTNYLAWGFSSTGWETNGITPTAELPTAVSFDVATFSGEYYVKSYRDMNRNGQYDADVDPLAIAKVGEGTTVAVVEFAFGDLDGDGVSDVQELADGSDPCDRLSFLVSTAARWESSDVVAGITNYVSWDVSPNGWAPNVFASFSDSTCTMPFAVVATNGHVYAKCFRDFNANGAYDEGTDALVVKSFSRSDNGKTVVVELGDSDADTIPDSVEMAEGTNPMDEKSYCFDCSATFTGIFETTNSLTAEIFFGNASVYGPTTMIGRTWSVDLGHRITTTKATLRAMFWDDVDGDGLRATNETMVSIPINISGHSNNVTNRLALGNFDKDNDGMADWWETANGLCPTNSLDAYGDPDGDWLRNIHEYNFGYDPNVSDATNTALACFTKSVDERLVGKIPGLALCKFNDYLGNGTNLVFEPNINFWAKDIDTSCASMWNVEPPMHGTNGWCRAGTAITPRHVIFAYHYTPWVGTVLYFMGTNNVVYTNVLAATGTINQYYNETDISVGLLEHPLPSSVVPAKILPEDYSRFIGSGKGLPSTRFDQEEKLIVSELQPLPHKVNQHGSVSCVCSENVDRKAFYEPVMGGDSGNPRFIVLNNQVVLLCTMWSYGSNSTGVGSYVLNFRSRIQTLMDSLQEGYEIQEVDLSGFDVLRQKGFGGYDYE